MAARVVCEQHRDGIPDDEVTVIPPLEGETALETLERKLLGAEYHEWQVERMGKSFHAWKLYADGDGTPERPNRKDRYFSVR